MLAGPSVMWPHVCRKSDETKGVRVVVRGKKVSMQKQDKTTNGQANGTLLVKLPTKKTN